MTRLAFLLSFVVLASQAGAQNVVTVRSGEHETFSRLVLYYGAPVDWKLGRIAKGYGLEVLPVAPPYDLSGVFDFIPKSRILDAQVEAGVVVLSVTCLCHAQAFEYKPGILVVDIKDGTAPPASPFETGLTALTSVDDLTDEPSAFPTLLPLGSVGSAAGEVTFPVIFPGASRPGGAVLVPAQPRAVQAGFEAALAEQLGRAMSQGLATAALPAGPAVSLTSRDDASSAPNVPAQESSEPGARIDLPPARMDPDQADHVEMRTGIDLARAQAEGTLEHIDPQCLPASDFALWNTVSDIAPDKMLSQARANLIAAGDTPAPEAVIALTEAYAYLGFGAEARSVLAAYPQPGRYAQVLADMALLLDHPKAGGSDFLQSQVSCNSAGALWGLLAWGETRPSTAVDEKAILRTASALPIHLRRLMGPLLSERLRELGRNDAAALVRDAVLRIEKTPESTMAIEIAKAQPHGPDSETAKQLERAAAGNSETSAEAEAQLLREIARVGVPVPVEKRDRVTALIHQTKGTAAGLDLLAAYLDALAAAGQHEDALRYLTRFSGSDFANMHELSPMMDRLAMQVATDTDDGHFLILAAAYPPDALPFPLPLAATDAISNRLLRLGFSDLSRKFLPAEVQTQNRGMVAVPDPARQIALAENALLNGRPVEALARVVQLETSDARAIRLRALEQAGAYREAGALSQADGDAATAARLAWMAEDWSTAEALLPEGTRKLLASQMRALGGAVQGGAAISDPIPGASLAALPEGTAAGDPGSPSLRETRSLIDRSQAIRAAADALLAAQSASN
ncbi:hypothetical protein [Pseudoruegeria sp. SK021]|uniref:hypothetical protein n=1 Tax=Pseudoruegeria sp. SK021 TaxID=1933035 RepID=UPI000A21ED49|nr:hypothetical protein [Pseudoruegeria sp. SK021]OSP56801.1 hypothetical protein BV911_02335 [Pseudoruegeria sp. SK021]